MRTCKVCHIEKELNDFYFSVIKDKRYYNHECKECHNVKARGRRNNPKPIRKVRVPYVKIDDRFKPELTDDIRIFLNKIERQRGYIDEVDAYRLTSYYIEVFGYENPVETDIKVELLYYYNSLLGLL